MTNSFDQQICEPVRVHRANPRLRLPAVGTWEVTTDRGAPLLSLELSRETLGRNLQEDPAAAPYFLVCFAWWHARITKSDPQLRLRVVGDPPKTPRAVRHYHRSLIALEALTEALGGRLRIVGVDEEPWPDAPVLNRAPNTERSSDTGGRGVEHRVEVQLTDEPEHAGSLPASAAPISRFHRQLPLGLFDGKVARDARWTPGNGAQADLWATSRDESVFHLFELKVKNNVKVGILPELLAYAWLIHSAKVGLPDGRAVLDGGKGEGRGLKAARNAERMVAWTLAPELHPLLGSRKDTPLSWFADGLRGRIDLGMLFYTEVAGTRPFGGWQPERTWRGWQPG